MTRLVPTLDEQHDVGVRFWQLLDEGIEQWVREKGAGSRRLRRRRQRHDASIPGQSDSSRLRIQSHIQLQILACPERAIHASRRRDASSVAGGTRLETAGCGNGAPGAGSGACSALSIGWDLLAARVRAGLL